MIWLLAQEVLDVLDGHGEAGLNDLGRHAGSVGGEKNIRKGREGMSGRERLGLEDVQAGAGEPIFAQAGRQRARNRIEGPGGSSHV